MESDSLVEEVYLMITDVLNKDQIDLLAVKIMLNKISNDDDVIEEKDDELKEVDIVKKNVYGIPLDVCYQSMMSIIDSSLGIAGVSE